MTTDRSDPALAWTLPFQLTKRVHRKVPDILLPEREENSQQGKIVVITGGGTGIGAVRLPLHESREQDFNTIMKAAARIWVRAKAAGVVIAGRRKEKLDETVQALSEQHGGNTKIIAVVADIRIEREVEALFKEVNKVFGRPADVVIANAAWQPKFKPLAEESVTTWWSVYVS
jgi:NAD(P)-dependent dehydrogenase (short-subunit alcohol dehydrogenase family)